MTVALRAGGKPMFVTQRYGKGQVGVFLGAATGDLTSTSATPFWLWSGWPGWVRRMVQLAASTNKEN